MGDDAEIARQLAFVAFELGRRLTMLIYNISEETTAESGDSMRMRELVREVAAGRLTLFDPVAALDARGFTPEERARAFQMAGGMQASERETAALILRAVEDLEEL
jgi:hypothetical protein